MRPSLTIPIAIVLGGGIIAGAVFWSIRSSAPSRATGNPALMRPISSEDHILGNPAASVMIVEYADFDCEYCKGFGETLHQLIANEGATGRVAWIYREFPLIEIHPNALRHAEAAECAARVAGSDGFWKFTNALFENQPVDPSRYGTLAANSGITQDTFATCLADAPNLVDKRIMADRKNALDMGARGTPFTLIVAPGKPTTVLAGSYSYDALRQLVEQALEP